MGLFWRPGLPSDRRRPGPAACAAPAAGQPQRAPRHRRRRACPEQVLRSLVTFFPLQATSCLSWTTWPTAGWARSPGPPCRPTATWSCRSPRSARTPPGSWPPTSVRPTPPRESPPGPAPGLAPKLLKPAASPLEPSPRVLTWVWLQPRRPHAADVPGVLWGRGGGGCRRGSAGRLEMGARTRVRSLARPGPRLRVLREQPGACGRSRPAAGPQAQGRCSLSLLHALRRTWRPGAPEPRVRATGTLGPARLPGRRG